KSCFYNARDPNPAFHFSLLLFQPASRSPASRSRGHRGAGGGYNVAVGIVIRDFQAEDFETLWRMDQECFPPGIAYSRQELKAYVRQKNSFTLISNRAEEDGNCGDAAGFIVGHHGESGHIITIDVAPTARRAGGG